MNLITNFGNKLRLFMVNFQVSAIFKPNLHTQFKPHDSQKQCFWKGFSITVIHMISTVWNIKVDQKCKRCNQKTQGCWLSCPHFFIIQLHVTRLQTIYWCLRSSECASDGLVPCLVVHSSQSHLFLEKNNDLLVNVTGLEQQD